MAVLGVGGKLYLKRDAPDPCLIDSSAVNGPRNAIGSVCPGYWSGDKVIVSCLPTGTGNFPPNPEGYATYYFSQYFLGPNRSHITDFTDNFYKTGTQAYPDGVTADNAQFYARPGDVSNSETIQDCTDGEYWIHIDELGAASFYTNRSTALEGNPVDRVPLFGNVAGTIGLAPFGSSDYNNAFWICVTSFGEYAFSDAQDAVSLNSVCDDAPEYESPAYDSDEYENADVLPRSAIAGQTAPYWQLICDLREWSLELSAPSVDTTAISEKFGEAVKSLVTGGGSTEFLIDRKNFDDENDNGSTLMKLLLMTEKGCKASARFYLVDRGNESKSSRDQIPGDLYYSTELLVTASAVNVRPTEIVAGTANFVTTGEIRLLEAVKTVIQ
jgi:hypothetical protein